MANAIKVHFGEPEFDDELIKIKKRIASALDGISDYRYRDSWGNAIFNVGDIFAEARQRTGQGHVKLAFMEIEMLYRELLANFEYQGECEISMDAEYCLDIMSEIADKAITLEDQDYIFNQCIALV